MVSGELRCSSNFSLNSRAPFWSLPSPGASGTGRTTFVNTLCESEVLSHKIADNADTAHVEEGIRIKPVNVGRSYFSSCYVLSCLTIFTLAELEEDGVRIALTIVDTPGFGDNIDNEFALVSFRLYTSLFVTTSVFSVSRKLLAILSANMTIFSLKSRESNVTHASGTTVYTLFCTSSTLR